MKSIDSLCSPYSLARPIQPSDMGYALDPCIANLAQPNVWSAQCT